MLGFTTNLFALVALTALPASQGSSLRSLQATLLANVCNIENGFDYVGFDISNAPSASADGCCDKCGAVANCAAWSWSNYNGGTCWFKSGRGDVAVNAGVKSALFFGAQVPYCQVENNVDYVNNDIGNKPSGTAEGCCSICQSTAGCRAFSWNSDNGGTCYLKSKGGQKISKLGVRSALAYPTGPSDCPAQEYGVDYVGNDMTNKPSASAEGCCSICKGILNCRAYSWTNQSGGTCYLKSGKTGTAAKAGVISAQVYANQIAKCNWEREVDYLNNDIGNAPGAVESCCQKCSDFAGCRAYSWSNYNGGTCYFKSNKGTAVSKPGVISSVVYY